MSVLFQALERAAHDSRLECQTTLLPSMPFPPISLQKGKNRWGGVALAVSLCTILGAGVAGFYHPWNFSQTETVSGGSSARFATTASAEKNSMSISAGDVVPRPAEEKRKIRANAEEIPPDLAQGITLSASSITATVPDKDTAAVMQKIQDAPAVAKVNTKAKVAQIVVQDSVPPELLKNAHDELVAENYSAALTLYDKALAMAPEHEAALLGKAYALQQKGRYQDAIAIERELLKRNPDDYTIKSNLTEALGAWGSQEAINDLRKMIAGKPLFAPAHAALAKIMSALGNQAEAEVSLQRAIELEPQNVFNRLNLAVIYDRTDRIGEALDLYRQVLDRRGSVQSSLPLTWDAIEQRIAYLAAK